MNTSCWLPKKDVKPFEPSFKEFRGKSTGSDFEASLGCVLMSAGTTKFPKFGRGVLPKSEKPTEAIKSVSDMRRLTGDALWFKGFANNRKRFARMFAFAEDPLTKSESEADEGSPPALSGPPLWTLFADDSDEGCLQPTRKRRKRAVKPKKERAKRKAVSAAEPKAPAIPACNEVAGGSEETRPPAK